MSKLQPEFEFQKQICAYLRLQYPKALFLSDTVAFLRLTMPQAVRNKQIQNQALHCPDLIIFEARKVFHGMFLEIKTKSVFKKDGETLLANEHVERQMETITALRERGYFAEFVWDFTTARMLLDWYFK